MSKIRIYKAAEKLNVDTKELMAILNNMGITVKSPISFITQSNYDSVLDSISSSKGDGQGLEESKVLPLSPVAAVDDNGKQMEEEATNLAIVSQQEQEKAIDQKGDISEVSEKVGETNDKNKPEQIRAKTEIPRLDTPKEKPVASKQETGRKTKDTVLSLLTMLKERLGSLPAQSLLSLVAIGLATAALLVAFLFQSSIADNTNALTDTKQSVTAMTSKLTAANSGIINNQNQINSNQEAIEVLGSRLVKINKTRIKSDLGRQAIALEELSVSLPRVAADKVKSISEGLRSLSSSM